MKIKLKYKTFLWRKCIWKYRLCNGGHLAAISNSSPWDKNGRHFADDVFGCFFVNENFCILTKISVKFVPKGPINKNLALVYIMAIILTNTDPFQWRIYAAQEGDELIPSWISNYTDCKVENV